MLLGVLRVKDLVALPADIFMSLRVQGHIGIAVLVIQVAAFVDIRVAQLLLIQVVPLIHLHSHSATMSCWLLNLVSSDAGRLRF